MSVRFPRTNPLPPPPYPHPPSSPAFCRTASISGGGFWKAAAPAKVGEAECREVPRGGDIIPWDSDRPPPTDQSEESAPFDCVALRTNAKQGQKGDGSDVGRQRSMRWQQSPKGANRAPPHRKAAPHCNLSLPRSITPYLLPSPLTMCPEVVVPRGQGHLAGCHFGIVQIPDGGDEDGDLGTRANGQRRIRDKGQRRIRDKG